MSNCSVSSVLCECIECSVRVYECIECSVRVYRVFCASALYEISSDIAVIRKGNKGYCDP